jgi:hypothetical protein
MEFLDVAIGGVLFLRFAGHGSCTARVVLEVVFGRAEVQNILAAG